MPHDLGAQEYAQRALQTHCHHRQVKLFSIGSLSNNFVFMPLSDLTVNSYFTTRLIGRHNAKGMFLDHYFNAFSMQYLTIKREILRLLKL